MSSTYEFWLTDDKGIRIMDLRNYFFFSYSRSVSGMGAFEIGLLYDEFSKKIHPIFQPDRRVDVWRSPRKGIPLRREGTFILRMPRIYTRKTDSVQVLILYGHDAKDLLNRRWVIQPAGYSQTRKTDYIDDMMKEIVREQMLYANALDADAVVDTNRAFPTGEFMVQTAQSLGPSVTYTFADRNVLDVLKELQDMSFQLYKDDSANQKIYFDVVPVNVRTMVKEILDEADPTNPILDEMGFALLDETSLISNAETGFRFETYAGLRGIDRTNGMVFSVENNNLEEPYYSKNHFEEINTVIVKGFGRGDSREWVEVQDANAVGQSRWNRCEGVHDASSEPDQSNLADFGSSFLYKNRAKEELTAIFLNVEPGPDSAQSMYGIDWDLGDLLPVQYAGKQFNIEIAIVYIAVDENGNENITGRNEINE